MKPGERTAQQLDPIGILAGYPVVVLVGAIVIGYAVISTVQQAGQINKPGLAVEALVIIAATVVYFLVSAGPAFAPLTAVTHVVVVAAALFAGGLFTASVWGTNKLVQDDWGQMAVALLLVGLALYRPPAEIFVSAAASACVLGAIAMSEAPFLEIKNSPWVYGTVVAGPVLILALAGGSYARVVIGALLDWQTRARTGARQLEPEVRASAARILHQEQVSLLNAEAVPFLNGILERDRVEPVDLQRAREIANHLRGHATAEASASWLRHAAGPNDRVHDPHALAEAMTDDQRAVLGAYLEAVRRLSRPGDDALVIDLAESSGRYICAVTARSTARDLVARWRLVPYLSVFRQAASGARLRVRRGYVTLRFEYVAP